MSVVLRIVVSLAFAMLASCAANETLLSEVKGTCTEVYNGAVCTWAKMNGDLPLEVGATIPIATIENSPPPQNMVWPPVPIAALDIPLPARAKSGLVHFSMYWEGMGHPPGAYMTPHYDFHFNAITSAERMAIDCSDLAKPAALPVAYALPDIPLPPDMAHMMGVPALVGLCVPQMGMHAVPASEVESTQPFRGTMVIGYLRGKPIFVEPMISRAMLLERKSFDLAVPEIHGFAGAHPTRFRADYDAAKQEYRLVFSQFVDTR
ncbi:MAG TPA: hypothetical protein VFB54_13950 [Burkholderiales bacterium]|nr:hypothetical protein [Burkholderiales bacterium]